MTDGRFSMEFFDAPRVRLQAGLIGNQCVVQLELWGLSSKFSFYTVQVDEMELRKQEKKSGTLNSLI